MSAKLETTKILLDWLDAHPKMKEQFKTDMEQAPLMRLMQEAYLLGRKHEQQCMKDSLNAAGFEVK